MLSDYWPERLPMLFYDRPGYRDMLRRQHSANRLDTSKTGSGVFQAQLDGGGGGEDGRLLVVLVMERRQLIFFSEF